MRRKDAERRDSGEPLVVKKVLSKFVQVKNFTHYHLLTT